MAEDARFELRLGLVLYGGVSLSVYMNGMARELLALVRAAHARRLAAAGQESGWVRRQWEQNPYVQLLEWAEADVVIDVIAGTSAGGLNGLLLAKALACGAPDLEEVSSLWLDAAQVRTLAGTEPDPHAAFSGRFMAEQILAVLQGLSAGADPVLAAQVPVLDLFVPATDLRGHRWSRWDQFHQKVEGAAHRYDFHLMKRSEQGAGGSDVVRGYARNDFQEGADPLLAKIGSATAAFPGAFPPVRIGRAEAEAAGVDVLGDIAPEDAQAIWFTDGGVLANKPFEPVLETVLHRTADRPVRRVLAYLEPFPEAVADPDPVEPHVLETIAAGVTLPMAQDIKEALDRLDRENRRREELMQLLEALDAPGTGERAFAEAAAAAMDVEALPSVAMSRLRRQLVAALTQALEGMGVSEAERRAAAGLVAGHLLERAPGACDYEYQAGRLRFLLARVRQHYRPGVLPTDAAAMKRLLSGLAAALEDWRNAAWMIAHAGRLGPQPATWQVIAAELDMAFQGLAGALRDGGAPGDAAREAAATLERYLDQVRACATAAEEEAQAAAAEALPLYTAEGEPLLDESGRPALTAEWLRQAGAGFAHRDQLLLSVLAYGGTGEGGPVGVYGLSPAAACGWVRKPVADKLTGEKAGHFSAFFDRRWRVNDIMWGRLDAAELLTRLVVQEARPEWGTVTAEEQLPGQAWAALAARRRQILAEAAPALDLAAIQRLAGGPVAVASAPYPVLRQYLQEVHNVGREGLGDLPRLQLAGELLGMLRNLIHALGQPAPAGRRWVALLRQPLLLALRPLYAVARLGWLVWQGFPSRSASPSLTPSRR